MQTYNLNIDLYFLIKQKEFLVELSLNHKQYNINFEQREHLEGIINTLDEIQDQTEE